MKYAASNIYNVQGTTWHRTPEAALRAAGKREGEGWAVSDEDKARWDWDADHTKAVKLTSERDKELETAKTLTLKDLAEKERAVYDFCKSRGDTHLQSMHAVVTYRKHREGYEYYKTAYEN